VPGEYTIAGGLTDAQRLARQAHVMAGATKRLLAGLGLAAGWSCLDVGCGDGQVAIAMAQAAGPDGRAVGVDVERPRSTWPERGRSAPAWTLHSSTADAARPIAAGRFDLAYARLVLSHLIDPLAVVRAMAAEVRSGGLVAVEDMFLGTLRSDPPAPALDRLQEVYGATVRFHGGDPTIGYQVRIHQVSGRRPD
jgi:ubiquinone/menaquinone biosynthesis C-methylase UbiE